MSQDPKNKNDFENAHSEQSIIGEFMTLLKRNKKFWMIPIVVVLLLLGLLVVLGGTAAAPFIYTLF